jgi:hypothetical protein
MKKFISQNVKYKLQKPGFHEPESFWLSNELKKGIATIAKGCYP